MSHFIYNIVPKILPLQVPASYCLRYERGQALRGIQPGGTNNPLTNITTIRALTHITTSPIIIIIIIIIIRS